MAGPSWTPRTAWRWAGATYRIRIPTTVELYRAVSNDDPVIAATLTLVACTDRRDHDELLLRLWRSGRGRMSAVRADAIADALTLAVTGTNRWTFLAIWQRSIDTWPVIDGTLLGAGVRVLDLPPEAATNAVFGVWWRILTRGDGSAWDKWMDQVTLKPPRAVVREIETMTDADAEADFVAIGAFAASASGAPPPTSGTTITVQGETL